MSSNASWPPVTVRLSTEVLDQASCADGSMKNGVKSNR
jgi:hypothetical protein